MPGRFHSRFSVKPRWFHLTTAQLLCLILILVQPTYVHAQRKMIDSLKVALSRTQDSSHVDCLNTISLVYSYLEPDTAFSYSRKAFAEASRIGYLRGMAMALNNDARIAGRGLHDYMRQERISRDVIKNYGGAGEDVSIEAHLNLALSLFSQGSFDRSEETCSVIAELARRSGDSKSLGEATALMGSISLETGSYGKSFEYFNQSLKMFKDAKDSYNTAIVLAKIGDLYRLAGDHQTAVDYYFQCLNHATGPVVKWYPLLDLGDMYYSIEQYDSNSYLRDKYMQVIKSLTIKGNTATLARMKKAEMLITSKEFDQAIELLHVDLAKSKNRNETNQVMRLLFDLAKAYAGKNDIGNAFLYTRELLRISKSHKVRQYIRDAYWQCYQLHDRLHHTDSAYHYYRLFTSMKDEIAMDEFSKRLAIYKAANENEKIQSQIELLSREKLINQQRLQLSEEQLKGESYFRNILILGIAVLVLFGFIVLRNIMLKQKNEANRREIAEQELNLQRMQSERAKRELQQQATELEMQALRAQMNPHFIFNSLNSINRFVLQNNKAQASEYLTKFSKLVRLILQNSQAASITLESEIESLLLYLELEAVRFEHYFQYRVVVDESLDGLNIKIPPLIIQPYAENAIWHGLMHKEDKGVLTIDVFPEEGMLCCKVTDDGIGRKRAVELKSKSASTHKSLGMRITAERISLLQSQSEGRTSIAIRDLVLPDGSAGGTEVLIKLPLQYD